MLLLLMMLLLRVVAAGHFVSLWRLRVTFYVFVYKPENKDEYLMIWNKKDIGF